jgi:hypothetical protein
MNYYYCSAKVEKLNEAGLPVMKAEKYLVKAESYTDAESKFGNYMDSFSSRFEDLRITKCNVEDVKGEGDLYFTVKVNYVTVDDNGAEKKKPVRFINRADDIFSALEGAKEYMSGHLGDWSIAGVQETAVVDFIDEEEIGSGGSFYDNEDED